MPNTIKMYYSKLQNMGDCLNELILEQCFGCEAERRSFLEGEICGIGSCLGQYTLHGTPLMKLQQWLNGIRRPHVYVWGTGFINHSDAEGHFFKKKMEFLAVRGELTRKNVERMTGKKLDIPMADAGILASELLLKMPKKRYEVGIVPHICDLKDPAVEELLSKYENAKLINVKDDPLQVVKEIAQCETIISSSLHGLIVADSFHIPNMYLIFGDRLLGDGYKFEDYYSAYGLKPMPRDLRIEPAPTLEEVRGKYQIQPELVEEKKRQMKAVFPFHEKKKTTADVITGKEKKKTSSDAITTKEKRISVVIPTYNRKEKLPACIESVLNQTYQNIEVLVVDDASTDGTEELFCSLMEGKDTLEQEQKEAMEASVLKGTERIREQRLETTEKQWEMMGKALREGRLTYLRYEENRGACYARNYGAMRAKGDFIAFQDSDDTWHRDKLEKQMAAFVDPKVDLCFCGMNRIAENGSAFYFPVHPFHREQGLEEFLAENRASTQTMLMKKEVWQQVQFDEEIRRYQDWDFGIRAAKDFYLEYLPEPLVDSEVGGDSISSRVKSYPHLLHLYKKHEELYEKYPRSGAVMNRRMGKRLHVTEPALAAQHFKKSFSISHSFYDLAYWFTDWLRGAVR